MVYATWEKERKWVLDFRWLTRSISTQPDTQRCEGKSGLGLQMILWEVITENPWASYQIRKIAGCACTWNAGNVFPTTNKIKSIVSDPSMHHGTCVTHVPWCMWGSLTRGGGEKVPGIPGRCATRNFTYLVRGPRMNNGCQVGVFWDEIVQNGHVDHLKNVHKLLRLKAFKLSSLNKIFFIGEIQEDACECLMLLIEIMDKGFWLCPTNASINNKGSFSELLFSFVLKKYIVCDICTMKSPTFETTSLLYVTPTDSTSMQELLLQEHKKII